MSLPVVTDPGRDRVAHLVTRLDRGGSAENTLLTCLGLDERGWKVTLGYGATVAPSERFAEVVARRTIRLVDVPALVRPVSPLKDLAAYRTIRRLLVEGDFDIVHTHSSKAGILGRRAARGLQSRVVHTPHGHVFEGYFSGATSRLFAAVERRAARWCDRIVVLTDRGREDHLARRVGQPRQFVTIPSGVDLEPYRNGMPDRKTVRACLQLPTDAQVVGCVARLTRVKGQANLLDAAEALEAYLPRLHVVLAGDGEDRPSLEEQASVGPLGDRVVFTGNLPDPRPVFAASDLFVLPSLNEGQGRAVVEAMAAGVPVIASAVGGLPEVLDGGLAGVLVPPGDPTALARAMRDLLSDPSRCRQLAEAGRRRAARYDLSCMLDRIHELYRELL